MPGRAPLYENPPELVGDPAPRRDPRAETTEPRRLHDFDSFGSIMLFAAAILYLTFQDIAPRSRLERHWAPPLGAMLGSAIALVGELLL